MILVGDIGGTKTVLALYSTKQGMSGEAMHETRFESGEYNSLEIIIAEFLLKTNAKPTAACFGVAGPVKEQQSHITNLPWLISAENIRNSSGIPKVYLLNDLEAIAIAIPHLEKNEFATLNEGMVEPHGNIVVIAPGTGLGIAFLVWTGKQYKACAGEGGHASFSPRDPQEMELLKYLNNRYGHVSFERICSGSQIPNIYKFLMNSGNYLEPDWLQEELKQLTDRTPVIIKAALALKADICEATLDIFVHALGTVISNMAVTLLPTGGIYLGGGIPPRILKRLQQPDFLSSISDKGRFSTLCSNMPVHVILNPTTALHGAALFGLEALSQSSD